MAHTSKPRAALPEQVAARIRAKIVDGSFAAGERLPAERELASSLRVNRGSVREGLKKLEQLRLIEILRGSGVRVLDAERASFETVSTRFEELFELSALLLLGTLPLALERASDAELEACAATLRELANAERPHAEFLDALRELQVAIARLTHNGVIVILANSVRRFLSEHEARREAHEIESERRKLRPVAQRLGVAIRARDAETAARAGKEFLRRSTKLLGGGIRA